MNIYLMVPNNLHDDLRSAVIVARSEAWAKNVLQKEASGEDLTEWYVFKLGVADEAKERMVIGTLAKPR
jgi:hypothetical protein